MLSKQLYNKFKKNNEIMKLSKKSDFDFLSDDVKSSILNRINLIKKVEEAGYKPTKQNIETMQKVAKIETVTIKKYGVEKEIKVSKFATLYKKKYGRRGQQATKEEQNRDILKTLMKAERGIGDKKLNIVKITREDDNIIHVNFEYLCRVVVSQYSEDRRFFYYGYKGENDDNEIRAILEESARQTIINEWGFTPDVVRLTQIVKATDLSIMKKKYNIEGMHLRDRNPILLTNLFGENIILNESEINCVLNCFADDSKKERKELLNILDDRDYITPEEVHQYCMNTKRQCNIYDLDGNILFKHIIRNSHKRELHLLCYNEHLYILTKSYKNSIKQYDIKGMKKEIMTKDELNDKFKSIIANKQIPANMKIYKCNLVSFIHNDIFYVCNPSYKQCKFIYNKLCIEEDPDIYINEINFLEKTVKAINDNFCKSLFPYNFQKKPYTYKAETFNKNRNVKSIDAVKFYGQCLQDLPYLIICDIRYAKVTANPETITEHYIYNVECYDSILTNTNGLYWGKTIIEAKKRNIPMKIKEEIETYKIDNYYTKIIDELYKMQDKFYEKFTDTTTFIKDIVNMHIGSLAGKKIQPTKKTITGNMIFKDTNTTDHIFLNIGDEKYAFEHKEIESDYVNILNNMPLHIQILDMAHMRLLEKIEELQLTDDDIIAIKTDNIIYYENEDKPKFNNCKYWKEQDTYCIDTFKDTLYENDYKDLTLFNPEYIIDSKSIIVDGFAGMGKTTKIINDLIPRLQDYIVLSPSHASIDEYRRLVLNCGVVQKYTMNNTIPQEKNIIIDEMGLMNRDGWAMCIKATYKGKRLFLFGDRNQLPPPCEIYREITDTFLNKMFSQVIKCEANYRNNIDVSIYKKLMKEIAPIKIIDGLIKKYLNSENPDIYIGIKCDTIEKKNLEILQEKGKYDPETKAYKNLEGEKVLCKCNDYSKYGLFNNFEATIAEYEEKYVIVHFENNDIKIKKSTFHKRFKFAYAVNLHCFQGKQARNIKFINDDIKLLRFPKTLYTLVSRVKEDLNDKQIEYNKTQEYNLMINEFDDIIGE
jgi:hypothetical protein